MNKKGFTLVELLAVIAILAILVIIALPNVLSMYRQARQNSFENEVKEVYRQAQQQFLLDSLNMTGGTNMFYASDGTANGTGADNSHAKKLDIQGGSGGTNFHYCVKIDNNGNVKTIKVSNGTYSYSGTDVTDAANIQSSAVKSGTDYAAVAGQSAC